jgi:hypothetical protein
LPSSVGKYIILTLENYRNQSRNLCSITKYEASVEQENSHAVNKLLQATLVLVPCLVSNITNSTCSEMATNDIYVQEWEDWPES